MPDEPTAAPPAVKATAEEKATARLQADNLAEIEKAQAAQRATLDANEADAWARAHGPAIVEE